MSEDEFEDGNAESMVVDSVRELLSGRSSDFWVHVTVEGRDYKIEGREMDAEALREHLIEAEALREHWCPACEATETGIQLEREGIAE